MAHYEPRVRFGRWGEDSALDTVRLLALCEMIAHVAEYVYRRYPSMPGLYEQGVRYQRPEDDHTDDPFADIFAVLEDGGGDCEDLVGVRVGELRARYNIAAKPDFVCVVGADGVPRCHVFVRLPDNSTEDPSVLLGMRRM